MGVPDGIREAIGRRLIKLSEPCSHILTVASVIGREFELNQLEHLIADRSGDELLSLMEEALTARIVEEIPRVAGRFQFTHVLVEQTLRACVQSKFKWV